MRGWVLLLLLMVLPPLGGCAVLPALPLEPPSPSDLLSRVQARSQALKGLKGLARVKVSSPEKSFIAQEIFFVRRPASLRAESLSPMGTPQFYLATDGQELSLFNPAENRYYRGQATAKHLSSALAISLEAGEVVAMLLGGLPPIPYDQASIRGDRKERLWILDIVSSSGGERQRLWVDPQAFHILRAEHHRPGSSLYLTFLDFRPVQGFLFPWRIQLISPESKARLSLEYQEVEVNPDWGAMDFQLPVPRGAIVLPLE